ncbi:MAG: SDR family NAD(P)-dependent oxidoreductase, partial [Casimicrobiaceae bacterium]
MKRERSMRVVILGAGDVAQRLVRSRMTGSGAHLRWLSLARSAASAEAQRRAGMLPIPGDLDQRRTLARLQRLARSAFAVLYLAPPPTAGRDDPRLRAWLASPPAHRGRNPAQHGPKRHRRPRRLTHVYVSTTGVYGDCAGERIDETRRLHPQTARAERRVAAERRWRAARRR